MKKIITLLILMCSIIEVQASLRSTSYRWRNDDGNETSATWRAAVNTPITISTTDDLLRLRMGVDNLDAEGEWDECYGELEYTTDNGATWTFMDNSPTQAFHYGTSALVTHNAVTTDHLGGTGFYIAGKIMNGIPDALSVTRLEDGERTEYEFVLKPTEYALPMTTYKFRLNYYMNEALYTPTLNTSCINATILSKTDASHCGPGSVQLMVTTPPGVIVSWRDQNNTELYRGNTFTTPVLNATTIYRALPIRQYGTNQECFGTPVEVTATIFSMPTVSIGNDTTICDNNVVNLKTVPNNFRNYLWSTSETIADINIRTAGQYSVEATDYNGCKAYDTMNLIVNPRPQLNLGNDTAICMGESLTIDVDPSNAGYTALWNDNTTATNKVITTAGNYSCSITNEFNCSSSDAINIRYKDKPVCKGINAIYRFDNTYYFSVIQPEFFEKIIWDLGDGTPPIEGPDLTHTFDEIKLYTIKVTLTSSCTNGQDTTYIHTLDALSSKDLAENKLSIYPNPANESITLNTTDLKVKNIYFIDMLGKIIDAPYRFDSDKINIQTQHLANGVYILQVEEDNKAHRVKIEIVR